MMKTKTHYLHLLLFLISFLFFANEQLWYVGYFLISADFFYLLFLTKSPSKRLDFSLLERLYDEVLLFDADWKLKYSTSQEYSTGEGFSEKFKVSKKIIEVLKSKIFNSTQSIQKYDYRFEDYIFEIKATPYFNNSVLLLQKNISRLKQSEEKLSHINLELEEMLTLKKNELNLKKEKFKTIFDKSSDAYFLLDEHFNISLFNEKVKAIFGEPDQVNFYEWLKVFSPVEQPKGGKSDLLFKSMKKSCDLQKELRFEWVFITEKGDEFSTEVSLTLLPLNQQTVYFMIIRNMMGQKKIEVELRKNLEREKELNEMRSKFISMASHEFKTPLATIITNMDIMEMALKKASLNFEDIKIGKYIDRMRAESSRLNILMDEVLQLGKIEAGKTPFTPQRVDISQFIDEYLKKYIIRITPQQTINLNKKIMRDEVWIDVNLITHVLDNLLSNAEKYSDDEVFLNVETTQEGLTIEVIDKGIGIPLSDFSHLFESFFRASNTGHIQGTGLGLVIAKEFVEMHGGVIVCESEEGVGTNFRIGIPIKR